MEGKKKGVFCFLLYCCSLTWGDMNSEKNTMKRSQQCMKYIINYVLEFIWAWLLWGRIRQNSGRNWLLTSLSFLEPKLLVFSDDRPLLCWHRGPSSSWGESWPIQASEDGVNPLVIWLRLANVNPVLEEEICLVASGTVFLINISRYVLGNTTHSLAIIVPPATTSWIYQFWLCSFVNCITLYYLNTFHGFPDTCN